MYVWTCTVQSKDMKRLMKRSSSESNAAGIITPSDVSDLCYKPPTLQYSTSSSSSRHQQLSISQARSTLPIITVCLHRCTFCTRVADSRLHSTSSLWPASSSYTYHFMNYVFFSTNHSEIFQDEKSLSPVQKHQQPMKIQCVFYAAACWWRHICRFNVLI